MENDEFDIIRRRWEEYNLSEDATIDRFSLELEAEKQASLTDKWVHLLEQAEALASSKKRQLQFIEASLFLDAKNGAMVGIIKDKNPTDAAAKAWVQIQPTYKKALEEKEKADNQVMKLQHAKTVMLDKKLSIKILSDLWVCGYFAKAYISKKGNTQNQDDLQEATKKKLIETMTKRKRREAEEQIHGGQKRDESGTLTENDGLI